MDRDLFRKGGERMSIWNLTVTAVFLAAFGALALRWLSSCGAALPAPFSAPLPDRAGEFPGRRELEAVFLSALLFRLCFALFGLFVYGFLSGEPLGISELPGLWVRWDGTHYVKLAELGYSGYLEDGKPLFLVFFPLYVWLVRTLSIVIPGTVPAGLAGAPCVSRGAACTSTAWAARSMDGRRPNGRWFFWPRTRSLSFLAA